MQNTSANQINKTGKLFFLIVFIITTYRVSVLFRNEWNLIFDEAQYWLWSLDLDWGYYSKPPLIAWIIHLSTSVCGNSEACIRLGSPLAHALTSIGVYLTALHLFSPGWPVKKSPFPHDHVEQKVAFWSGLVYLTLPAVSFSSMLISTDPFLLTCWSWSLYFIVRALRERRNSLWFLGGIVTGAGLLAKYAMILFFPCLIIALLLIPELRQNFKKWGIWLYIGVSLLILAPNLVWNYHNDLVTISHTRDNANLGASLFHPDKMLEFLSSQLAVFGPVLFICFIWLIVSLTRTSVDKRYRYLIAFSLPYITFFIVISLLSRAHANWAAPTYIAASILVTAWLLQSKIKKIFLGISLVIHLLIGGFITNYTTAMNWSGFDIKKGNDPFFRQRGMQTLGEEIAKQLASLPAKTLISDSRTIIAPLLYYVRPFPQSWIKINEDGVISDYYEMHSDLGARRIDSALFVSDHPPSKFLNNYFDNITPLDPVKIEIYPHFYSEYSVYLLENYHSPQK